MPFYESITLKSADGYSLSLRLYDTSAPKAVVKCIHGMEEHQGRYEEFACFLRENGYAVVTADLRGHGENAPLLSHIADKQGEKLLLDDEREILAYIRKKYPQLRTILLGHSMGTIIARALLQTESEAFSQTVLSGYPNPQGIAGVGAGLTSLISLFKGTKGHSGLVDGMVLGGFSKAIPHAETPQDWLSVNRENRDRYIRDPLCGQPFTLGSYHALFRLISMINRPELYQRVNRDMPILLVSGADDPCTGGEKGRKDSLDRLEKAGFKNISVVTLEGMRHEILNETDRQKTYDTILQFIEKNQTEGKKA